MSDWLEQGKVARYLQDLPAGCEGVADVAFIRSIRGVDDEKFVFEGLDIPTV